MNMNGNNTDRSKAWNIYTNADPLPPQTGLNGEAPWKSFGTSMNAISFGFVATAIFISMFLIMAIFEHLLKPNPSFSSSEQIGASLESGTFQKLQTPQTVRRTKYAIVMPGQQYPTYIAEPAPFPLPCQPERIHWPSHHHHHLHHFRI